MTQEEEMQVRIPVTFVFGALAMAAAASAQTPTTTSTKRIPISKASGELGPQIDTVTVYRTDTLTQYRVDTVTVSRVDTLTQTTPATVAAPMPIMLRQIGGFYIGLDAGAAVPTGDELNTVQSTGWHADVPFGIDPVGSPLGVRFNVGYSHFGTRSTFNNLTGTPQVWTGDADLKLRLPMTSSFAHRFQIYGVGGATYNRYKNLVQFSNNTGAFMVGTTPYAQGTTFDDTWHSTWGWNAGGGLQFGFGRTNLFVESRYVHFSNNGALNQIPVVVGLNWY